MRTFVKQKAGQFPNATDSTNRSMATYIQWFLLIWEFLQNSTSWEGTLWDGARGAKGNKGKRDAWATPLCHMSDSLIDHQCSAGFHALRDETVKAFSRQCYFWVIINDRRFISIVLAFIIHRLPWDWLWRKLIPWIFVLCNVKLIADAWLGEILSAVSRVNKLLDSFLCVANPHAVPPPSPILLSVVF